MESLHIASTSAPASAVVFRSFASASVFPIRVLTKCPGILAIMAKKRYTEGYLYTQLALRLVAAAGAGQVLQRQGRAVSRRTAAPAVGARTHVGGRRRRIGTYHRRQRYDFAINVGFDACCD